MSKKKEWIEVYVWEKVRTRVMIELDKGAVVNLLVQLEINDGGWKAAVRYNFAHGKPHRDKMTRGGKKEKAWLEGRSLEEIFTYAEIDIRSHWKKYLKECGYIEDD
ncbi:MAG: hypothetical protein WC974_04465 [Thermoplasmata archaeon]